jgi:hypothetical protein
MFFEIQQGTISVISSPVTLILTFLDHFNVVISLLSFLIIV